MINTVRRPGFSLVALSEATERIYTDGTLAFAHHPKVVLKCNQSGDSPPILAAAPSQAQAVFLASSTALPCSPQSPLWETALNTTATRIRKLRVRRGNGIETLVDQAAIAFLMLGCVVGIGFLLMFSPVGTFAAFSSVVSAIIQWLLFRCLAEHIRLQKKIAGVTFEGSITGAQTQDETFWACSNCGQMLHSDNRCDGCGADIADDR